MSIKNKVDLKADADVYLPDNITEEISAGDVRQRIKDLADSTLNLIDGGLVIQAQTGYSTPITPSSNYAFATKKYVDDGLAGVSPVWGSITGTITDQTDLITYLSTNYQAKSTNLTSLSGLTYASTSFVKMTASGTFALDTNTYLTSSSLTGYAKLDLTNQPFTGDTLTHSGTLGKFTSALNSVSPYFALQNTSGNSYFAFSYNTVNTRAVWNVSNLCSQLEIFYNNSTALKLDSTSISANVPTSMIWYAYPSFSVMTIFTASTGNWNFAGTAQNLLTIANGIKIGNNTDTAATAGGGSIKYSGGLAYISDGSTWNQIMTGTSAGTTDYTFEWTVTGALAYQVIQPNKDGSFVNNMGFVVPRAMTLKEIYVVLGDSSAGGSATLSFIIKKIAVGLGNTGNGSQFSLGGGTLVTQQDFASGGALASRFYRNQATTGLSIALSAGDILFCETNNFTSWTANDVKVIIRCQL